MRFIFLLFLIPSGAFAQVDKGFEYGAITPEELQMKVYPRDTSAVAVVLNEFGYTQISNEDPFNIVLDYHVRIKILKQEGLEYSNYEIPLRINGKEKEYITEIQASTFNFGENGVVEAKVSPKGIFLENRNKYRDYKKFALPDAYVGSIIEIHYVLESPFKFNWRTWEFQSEIPKIYSEYWARIPGNYVYNITLRGQLRLSKNESGIIPDCYHPGGSMKADCAQLKYAMKNIPAFRGEEYMTAKSNFLSYINFELSELKKFDGSINRFTETWDNVDKKMQNDEQFGSQIKQARKIWSEIVEKMTGGSNDPLEKARVIFNEIKNYYLWDDTYGHFTELGAKKAFQSKKGNVADINLSLTGALQAAGIQAEPALVSTRANGLPVMLHPVMTDFNYVIVRLTIGVEQFWLDATHRLHPFGFVPERCLNGKVRVMSKVSEWTDLKIKDKDKKAAELSLSVGQDGSLGGILKVTHSGYDAFEQRKKYFSYSSTEEYWKAQAKKWTDFEVSKYSCKGADSLEGSFTEQFELLFNEKTGSETLYISPFLIERWEKNPFRSNERSYPVDFGTPLEETTIFKLDYQNLYAIDELPKSSVAALPQSGGRYAFSVSNINNGIQMTSSLTLNKSVYSSDEYHYLKELFARVLQTQQSQFVLKKNK
jgi:hypothetical protein